MFTSKELIALVKVQLRSLGTKRLGRNCAAAFPAQLKIKPAQKRITIKSAK